jgi:iron(III) transport system ATP-binding protein
MTVTLEAVSKRFAAAPVIDSLTTTFRDGNISVLLGASGCGKTTTLRCIAGLETPDEGRITIGGSDVFWHARGIDLPPERRELAMVFQSYAIWPHMTVRENVGLPLRAHRVARREAAEMVDRALQLVGLREFADRMATQLSGGQQQRVALARSIVRPSRVVLLDEPLSNLDAQLRVAMRKELKSLHRELRTTMIFVTHDQEEAMMLADEVFLFDQGRILQQGPPLELYRRPVTRFVAEFVGKANFIEAIASPDGDSLVVRTLGGEIVARLTRADRSLTGPVLCVARPEAWQINIAGEDGIPGRVKDIVFLGDRQELTVTTDAGELSVMIWGHTRCAVGDTVRVTTDDDSLHLLPRTP